MKSMSWLEYHTRSFLNEHNYRFIYQHKYLDLLGVGGKTLSFDFLVKKDNQDICLIECQGEQHFKPVKKFGGAEKFLKQQIHDELKRKYAKEIVKIPLIEIPYTSSSKDKIYEILKEYL